MHQSLTDDLAPIVLLPLFYREKGKSKGSTFASKYFFHLHLLVLPLYATFPCYIGFESKPQGPHFWPTRFTVSPFLKSHQSADFLLTEPKKIEFFHEMETTHMLKLVLVVVPAVFLLCLALISCFYCKRRTRNEEEDVEGKGEKDGGEECEAEGLVTFSGGEELTISEILEASGEVIGKSNYGTLYKALLQKSNTVRLLRFLRPVCTARGEEFSATIQLLGRIRHPNLVPLLGFYAGPRGEKLLVHPFYKTGNLAQFIRDGSHEAHNWAIIYGISIGLARGLDHLHNGFQKPIAHGNLKSKNILLNRNLQPHISDFGLHLLLNPATGQKMLEASAAEGYKAPELIKMRDVSIETDIYSLGVIFMELLTGKEPISEKPTPNEDFYLPTFLRNAVLDHRITDLYHPDILLRSSTGHGNVVTEEVLFKFFQLAMACCSPSPSLRPDIRQVIKNLEEIRK